LRITAPVPDKILADLFYRLVETVVQEEGRRAGQGQESDRVQDSCQKRKSRRRRQVKRQGQSQGRYQKHKQQEEGQSSSNEEQEQALRKEARQEVGLACERACLWCTRVHEFNPVDGWDPLDLPVSCPFNSNDDLDCVCACIPCKTWTFLSDASPICLEEFIKICSDPSLIMNICSYIFEVTILKATSKVNIFDYTTFPNIVAKMEREMCSCLLTFSAPSWLLGSRYYTKAIHTEDNKLYLPDFVVDSLSVGQKYIWPISLNKKVVKDAWDTLHIQATNNWVRMKLNPEDLPVTSRDHWDLTHKLTVGQHADKAWLKSSILAKNTDEFFDVRVPFTKKVIGADALAEIAPITEAFDKGWSRIDAVLRSVPFVDKKDRVRNVSMNEALQSLNTNRLLVKPTDKNLGTVIVSLNWYEEKVHSFITSNKGYKIIDEFDAQVRLSLQIRQIIKVAELDITGNFFGLDSFLISRLPGLSINQDTGKVVGFSANWSKDVELTIPIFNGLPKIHKTPWAIRPIVPCHSVIQQPVSAMLSIILKTLLPDFPWILISTKHLCKDIEGIVNPKLSQLSRVSWTKRVFICSGDISGFYTNVNIRDCSEKLGELFKNKYGNDESGIRKAHFVNALFHAQQDNLIFKVKTTSSNWLVAQKDGLAMGMDAAPDIANLYAAYYEQQLFVDDPSFFEEVILYRRYIDDVFCVVLADSLDDCKIVLSRLKYPGLKINWEYSLSSGVFLDMNLWRDSHSKDQRLKYHPYRKPLNNFERLPWCTGHSLTVLKAAFKSEVHRLAVSSYTPQVFQEEMSWLSDLYISRGYPPLVVRKWIKDASHNAYI
jgi:hypothetical protein